jgi:type IX secretion system PorP/SprF family membrane protein
MINIKFIKTALVFTLFLGTITTVNAQQNIQFTQYIFNSLSVNPAYAGYKEEWFAQMALRSQWTGVEGAPQTGQVSIDGILDQKNKRMGVGLQLASDKLGPQTASSIYANYAYRIRLNVDDTERLSFGLGLGVTNYGLNGSMLNPVDKDDQNIPTGQLSNMVPDARFGVYYYNSKFYIGASVMDLFSNNTTKNNFNDAGTTEMLKRNKHMYLIAGMINNLSEELKFRPSLMIKEDFKGPTSADLGALFIFNNKFWIGGSYRTAVKLWEKDFDNDGLLTKQNSISGIVQLYINHKIRIGYSYDYMLNNLSSHQGGSHEITLGLTFPKSNKRLLSPRFF